MERLQNIVIAQVGRNNYKEAKYKQFDESNEENTVYYAKGDKDSKIEYVESSFSFYTIYRKLLSDQKIDAFLLVGTKTSSWWSLCEFFAQKAGVDLSRLDVIREEDTKIKDVDVVKKKIEDFLELCIADVKVRIVIQYFGILSEESQKNFYILRDSLSELMDSLALERNNNETVRLHLDISNGFRSFPVYLLLWMNYMAQMQPNREIKLFLYYGMFDCKMKLEQGFSKEERNCYIPDQYGEFVPFVEMNDAIEIMKWTSAVAEFYSNGSVKQIKKLLREKDDLSSIMVAYKGERISLTDLFNKFDFAMNSNNLKLLQETTVALAEMKEYLGGRLPEYVKGLLEHISDDFVSRFVAYKAENSRYGMLSIQMAKWYLEQGRIGDAVIALQEGMITYVLERFPQKCATLVNKKDRSCDLKTEDMEREGILFDFRVREIIRKNVFDIRDMEEVEWLKEYKYLCDNLRNPAMRMQYSASGTAIEVNMDEAEENLRALIQKLLKEELTGRMQARMDELLKMKDYDVFISYRSKYQREGDGVEITRKLEEFLEKQTYFVNKEEQRPYEVFRDESRMAGETGEFTPTLKWKIRNSEYFLLVLGPKAFHHPFEKRDVFYQEILTALDKDYEIDMFVICMEGFEIPDGFENYPSELQKVAQEYQWIGRGKRWKEEEMEELKRTLLDEITENRKNKLNKI